MGSFLSLRTEIPNMATLQPSQLLAPCFSDPFFTPIALGGLNADKGGDDWYLAGYALENFISNFIERGIPKPASIHRVTSAENEAYVQSIADALTQKTSLAGGLSPFETAEYDITFVRDVQLPATVLEDADLWTVRYPKAAIYLYGTVDLASQDRAFRFRFPDEMAFFGAPFLWIRLGLSPFTPNMTEILIYSQSLVWLQSDQGTFADTNLENLAAFVFALVSAQPSSLVTLRLEGSVFENERVRIERAFAGIINSSEKL